MPPSGGTWTVRIVRLRAVGIDELGSFCVSNRLRAGRSKIEVPPELRVYGSFWAYGEPTPSECPGGERRRITASRGLPCLMRVDLRDAEVEVFPLTFHFDLDGAASFAPIFLDEELRRFYGALDPERDWFPRDPAPIPPVVLREDLTGIEATLAR